MMKNSSRREQLAYMVGLIENSDMGTKLVEKAIEFAKRNGIEANMHIGMSEEFFENENHTAEWIMGQFVDGYETNNYLAFNSGINIAMSFLDYTYGYKYKL